MNFPEKLQKLRKERGWSQEELAQLENDINSDTEDK